MIKEESHKYHALFMLSGRVGSSRVGNGAMEGSRTGSFVDGIHIRVLSQEFLHRNGIAKPNGPMERCDSIFIRFIHGNAATDQVADDTKLRLRIRIMSGARGQQSAIQYRAATRQLL